MTLPRDDYKTFDELRLYARKRAVISIKRRGHQEAAYWVEVEQFAAQFAGKENLLTDIIQVRTDWISRMAQGGILHHKEPVETFRRMTREYAQCVHCCKMLRNRGEQAPRLSMKWLRQIEGKL